MKRLATLLASTALVATATTAALAEKWDMPMAYSATNFHSEKGVEFANKVKEYTGGKIEITVHPGGSLFKGGEIKQAFMRAATRAALRSDEAKRMITMEDLAKACASVLMAQKLTPSIRVCIIRLTALPPPPPTPRILMTQGGPGGGLFMASSSSNISAS